MIGTSRTWKQSVSARVNTRKSTRKKVHFRGLGYGFGYATEGLPGDEGHEGRVERFEGEMDRVNLKRGRVPGVVRFEPRSWTEELRGLTLPSPHDPTKSTMLSIATGIPSFVAIPMLDPGFSKDDPVAQSQGFRSAQPFDSRGLA